MDCIRCRTEMEKRYLRGVLADCCPGCFSVWLDRGELQALQKVAKTSPKELVEQAMRERKQERFQLLGMCPRCGGQLAFHCLKGVRLDKCKHCEGIFFDHGELDEFIKERKHSFLGGLLEHFWSV